MKASALPPGPGGGLLAETVRFHRDPLRVLERCQAKHGDVFTLRLAFVGPVVVVAGPALAELAESDPSRSAAGEARRSVLPMASPRSVFGGDSHQHAAARERLAAVFAPDSIAARREEMAEIAAGQVRSWPRDRPFHLLPRLRRLADDIFVRLILGVSEDRRAREMVDALGTMLRTPGNPPLPPPGPGDGVAGGAGLALFERRRARLDSLLIEEVHARRGAPLGGRPDVLDALLRSEPTPSDSEVLDEVVTLMMAGQEPPSIALAWVLDRLARRPRLAREYLAAEGTAPLRSAVALETLRLRPPALAMLRTLREPLEVGRHELPPGTATMVPIPLVHRDPRLYDEPNRFRPDRWMAEAESPPPFAAFGGGGRRCVGEPLALAEIAAVVPAVLRTVRLRPLWPRSERMVLRGTVMVPHRSLPVVAR